jgi:hypothetical protein
MIAPQLTRGKAQIEHAATIKFAKKAGLSRSRIR